MVRSQRSPSEKSQPSQLGAATGGCLPQVLGGRSVNGRGTGRLVGCVLVAGWLVGLSATAARGQVELERPPINYVKSTPDDAVARLQKRLQAGEVRLEFDRRFGYLPAVLEQLGVARSSQVLVFSKTSLQVKYISPRSPRAIYFSDDAYVGWVQGGHLELSAVDPRLGANFYLLEQLEVDRPRFRRQTYECLQCHGSMLTRDVPGHMVRSVATAPDGHQVVTGPSYLTDHHSPFRERWGGWYVTGEHGEDRHLGNLVVRRADDPRNLNLESGANASDLAKWIEPSAALTGHSDIVALMVLEHQANLHNRLTHASFLARGLLFEEEQANREAGRPLDTLSRETQLRLREEAETVVEHLLFVGEYPLRQPVTGKSGFAEDFARRGPRDGQGRSLREFDLRQRMFRYPCSYLLYSAAFDQLPEEIRREIYQRLWQVLTAETPLDKYAHLSAADRTAIREIVRDTKTDLPEYWK